MEPRPPESLAEDATAPSNAVGPAAPRKNEEGLWIGIAYVTAPIFGMLGAFVAVIGILGIVVPSYPEKISPLGTATGLIAAAAGLGLYVWLGRRADKKYRSSDP